MMMFAVIVFWVSLSVLFFCYIGYGLLLYGLNTIKRWGRPPEKELPDTDLPAVTLIIAVYNEAPVLLQKLENTLAIDYPKEKMEIIFVTDGSTDGSDKLITGHPSVSVFHQDKREGKMAALTRVMRGVQTPIVFFSDANTMLNSECIRRMVRHYSDPKTGGVAGEKKIVAKNNRSAIGEAEGLYWQYESFMKRQDADFHTVVGAAGELYSIRTELFESPGTNFLLDDFIISMNVCLKGYKIKYEPGAFAIEYPSASLEEEAKRKIRISAGAYQTIGYLKESLNVIRHPLLSFQYASRRLLRWVFCPMMLLLVLLTNFIIASNPAAPAFYTWMLYAQLFFYLLAMIGWAQLRAGNYMSIVSVPLYFLFMNFCLVRGFIRFLKKDHTVLWEKSLREMAR